MSELISHGTATLEREATKEAEVPAAIQERLAGILRFAVENPGSPKITETVNILSVAINELRKDLYGEAPKTPESPIASTEEESAIPTGPVETDPIEDSEPTTPDDESLVLKGKVFEEEAPLGAAMTYEQARQTERHLSDEVVGDMIEFDLKMPDGSKAFSLKSYLDNVPMTTADKEYVGNAAEVNQFHGELSDLVAQELKFHAPPAYMSYLEERKKQFAARLQKGKQVIAKYIEGRQKGLDLEDNPYPRSELELEGLTVMVEGGKSIDLLESHPKDVHPNIQMQREIVGRFVHWSSEEYVDRKVRNDKPEITKRIYLNPSIQQSVTVFRELIHALDAAGLAVKAKIFDRTDDAYFSKSYSDTGTEYGLRGDGIVVYASDDTVEKTLRIVQDVYDLHSDAFAGRDLSRVPQEIAPGLGVGDEPRTKGTSLTSHRSDVLEGVMQKVRSENLPTRAERIRRFRELWAYEAVREGINPNNMAFNT